MVFRKSLNNGLDVVLKEDHFSKMVAVQCWVHVGSIHEEEGTRGMAHLVEHMLFKGTERRGVGEISKVVEGCGGDINAYTTFDKTVFHLTLSSQHIETALDLLSDALFHSKFDEEELEREKEVVCEEIRRNNDNPSSLVGKKIFERIYKGTEAARPIIGSEEEISSYTREDVYKFYKRWYNPKNMFVVAVGDFSYDRMYPLIEKYWSPYDAGVEGKDITILREESDGIEVLLERGDFQQPRLEVAFSAPPLEHSDTASLDVVAFVLGAGDGSRLNRELRDKKGVVSAVGATLFSPKFGGLFELSAFPILDKYTDSVYALAKEIAQMKYNNPITDEEIERARANLRADRVYQEETVTGQAKNIGYGLTTSYGIFFDEIYHLLVNRMTVEDVKNAVTSWLSFENVVISGLVPEGVDLTEKDVADAFKAGFLEGKRSVLSKKKTPQTIRSKSDNYEPQVIELSDSLKLVYKKNTNSGMFNLVCAAEGGLRAEASSTYGEYNAIASLLANATTSRSYEELIDEVEGRGATLMGYSGKDSIGIKLQCLTEHANELITTWSDCFLSPNFPKEQWGTIKREILTAIDSEGDSSANIAIKKFQESIFGKHPYRSPVYGTKNTVSKFTAEGLERSFNSMRENRPWVLGCVGSLSLDEAKRLVLDKLDNFAPNSKRAEFLSEKYIADQPRPLKKSIKKVREQTHIVMGYKGISWDDEDRANLDVLGAILGGSGGRLFTKLRDQQGLAYVVTSLLSYGCHPGVFGVYIACAPEKKAQASQALIDELNINWQTPPTTDELERAKNYIIGGHETDMQRSESQAMTMALMESYGIGYDDFQIYPERIRQVTKEGIMSVASRLIQNQNLIHVTVEP